MKPCAAVPRIAFNPTEIGEAMGISLRSVYAMIRAGQLPVHDAPGGRRKILLSDAEEAVRRHWPVATTGGSHD